MGSVARELHRFGAVMLVVVGALLLAGCPPPPLQLDQPDGGGNTAPNIRTVLDGTGEEFGTGVDATTILVGMLAGSMTVTIEDPDVEDTMYLHAFLDYDLEGMQNQSPVSRCEAGPTTPRSTERTARCPLNVVCSPSDAGPNIHMFEIWVFDREPAESTVAPPNKAVLPPGEKDNTAFGIICEDPET